MSTAVPVAGRPRPVRHRLLYAWTVTLRVLGAYLFVEAATWVRGRRWREQALLRCHRRCARRVELAVLRLQGLFVKVGQLVSMLTNVLPAEFRSGLEGLQDQVAPRPWEEVAARLAAELGPSEGLFAEVSPQAIASASLAQVHEAVLPDGRRVAVKVQHQGIEELARRDLDTIRRILRLVALFVRVRGLPAVHGEVRAVIEQELDFEREARNIAEVAAAFAADAEVVFPRVLPELSTSRVLTTTFVEGVKVSRRDALEAAGHDRREVAERIVGAYARMIFEHGVYHADPHPGNLFVCPDGRIAFVDFGAVGRLSPAMREGLPELLDAVIGHDPVRILAALRRMGFVARAGDERTAERVVSYLHGQFLEELTRESWNLGQLQVDARVKLEALADLRRLGVSLRDLMELFEVPRDWILLDRTILLLVGLCAHLAPEMNPLTVLRPHLEELLLGRDRDWGSVVAKAAKELAAAAVALPVDLRRLLARAERGELEVRVPRVEEGLSRLASAVRQLLWGLFASTGGVVAYAAAERGDGAVSTAATAVAAAAALLLAGSLWRSRRR